MSSRRYPPPAMPARPKARPAPAADVLARLHEAYPGADCSLDHADAFQLLISTILSAQCTDARVNAVTPALFRRFPDPAAMAGAGGELEELIRSTGFFNAKAKSIRGACRTIVEAHGGLVPRTMEELHALPGRRPEDRERRPRKRLGATRTASSSTRTSAAWPAGSAGRATPIP